MALPLTASLPQSGSIVSRWKLDETSGNRADSVGSNTLVDQNTVGYVAGQFSTNAANFVRTNSEYLSISDASQTGLDITGDLSWSAWVNFQTLSGYHLLFGKSFHTGNQRSYLLYEYTSGADQIFSFQTNPDGVSNSTGTVTWAAAETAAWHHIALAYDASAGSAKLYIDGTQYGSTMTGLATSNFNSSSEFAIGSYHTSDYMDAYMQDALIWSYQLSDTDVTNLYNAYFPVSSSIKDIIGGGFTLFPR